MTAIPLHWRGGTATTVPSGTVLHNERTSPWRVYEGRKEIGTVRAWDAASAWKRALATWPNATDVKPPKAAKP
jgi:hypothetical protein